MSFFKNSRIGAVEEGRDFGVILPSKKWVPNDNVRWKEESRIDVAHKEPPDTWHKAVSFNADQTYIPHAGRDPAWPYVSKANSLKLLLLLLLLLPAEGGLPDERNPANQPTKQNPP